MHSYIRTIAATAIVFAVLISGCTGGSESGEHESEIATSEGQGEHGNEGAGEHGRENGGEGGEESGTEYALDETYDAVRKGVRLIIAFDAEANSFNGTVENVTNQTLSSVRVEVHLSNGIELGPTTPGDLGPGEQRAVSLQASETSFSGWTPHAEVGRDEHGGEGGHS